MKERKNIDVNEGARADFKLLKIAESRIFAHTPPPNPQRHKPVRREQADTDSWREFDCQVRNGPATFRHVFGKQVTEQMYCIRRVNWAKVPIDTSGATASYWGFHCKLLDRRHKQVVG